MSQGIDSTLIAIEGVKSAALQVVAITKGGFQPVRDIAKLFQIMLDLKKVAEVAPDVWPELKDVDAQESGKLAPAVYSAVKEVVEAIKA